MSDRHFAFWPASVPHDLPLPQTSLYYNVDVSANRYPDKPYIVYYDTPITFARFHDETERLAGFLEQECGVKRGDRVLLYTQNSPQFIIGYYAILRANAVVVPVNPMNRSAELRHYRTDTGATVLITTQDLFSEAIKLFPDGLQHMVVGAYSDYLSEPTDLAVPDFVRVPRGKISAKNVTAWHTALARNLRPGPSVVGPDDLCVMPYTSGTTGFPKGCMHTHRSAMHTVVVGESWFDYKVDDTRLAALPLFHVTGMQGSMSGPLYTGSTVVLMSRWDRDVAAQLIERYRVKAWKTISTMVVDFLANPRLRDCDLSSLWQIGGGGAAMPEAIAKRLHDEYGLGYVEGYGLSETMAPTHTNPPDRPKRQCLGIPICGVEARVVDPNTWRDVAPGESGEIVVRGPQVFLGYWNNPEATKEAFVDIDGKRFFRTGDLGRIDEDGYYFMTDRLKRMINASGFKVWPAEVETMMYQHPAIQEVCVIAATDVRRGETVKAVVVLKPSARGNVTEEDIIDWTRGEMAAYKYPRIVEFVDALPKSGSGKIMWRALQEQEARRGTSAA